MIGDGERRLERASERLNGTLNVKHQLEALSFMLDKHVQKFKDGAIYASATEIENILAATEQLQIFFSKTFSKKITDISVESSNPQRTCPVTCTDTCAKNDVMLCLRHALVAPRAVV